MLHKRGHLSEKITYSQSYIVELSESLSDGVSEQRLSEDARSGLTRKEVQNASCLLPKKLFCKEALGNACIKWLPVL